VCDFDGVKLLWVALSLYTFFGRVLFWRLFQVWELFLFLLWVSYWCLSTFFSPVVEQLRLYMMAEERLEP